jgi:uncharacterized protein YigE (DUF2233 family)
LSRRGLIIASALAMAGALALAALPRGGGLAVRAPDGSLHRWWHDQRAPRRWDGSSAPLASALEWRAGPPGLEWGEIEISGAGEASWIRVVVARLDPARFNLSLVLRLDHPDSWSLDAAPPEAVLAVNAGMFVHALPWGWLVLDGEERLPPGVGPLSSAVVLRRDGTVGWVDGDDLSAWRGSTEVEFAFQSYPSLLVGDGEVPAALLGGSAVNRAHRDARVALGLDRKGKLLLALTRFDAPLPAADRIPFGLTLPEMAAVMGALGARQAVSLDGGISAQLMLRDAEGEAHRWPGLRRVPLALLATPHR